MMNDLWVESYRPKTVNECILPQALKSQFNDIVKTGEVPNMLFTGTSGLGKTTVARAICNELGLDYILINASEDGNIDTLRGKIKQFASSISLAGGYKVVILDEADYLNAQSTQPALRGFIEEFSNNCRFILTCNFKNKIIEPLHSRCGVYEFNTSKKGMAELCQQFMARAIDICKQENVTISSEQMLAELIMQHAPDWRRVLNEMQRHSTGGTLTLNAMSSSVSTNLAELFSFLKNKKFTDMRKWVAQNMDVESAAIFRGIYDNMGEAVTPETIPNLVLVLADYQYKNAFVPDKELNMVACLTEVMAQVEFK
jgi:DNA polymerase III delta prime subunit